MEWTDIRLTVAKADAENAEAVATLIAEGGIYIEDYSDIEQQVAEIAHVDLSRAGPDSESTARLL